VRGQGKMAVTVAVDCRCCVRWDLGVSACRAVTRDQPILSTHRLVVRNLYYFITVCMVVEDCKQGEFELS
jgi:hypothetical protein